MRTSRSAPLATWARLRVVDSASGEVRATRTVVLASAPARSSSAWPRAMSTRTPCDSSTRARACAPLAVGLRGSRGAELAGPGPCETKRNATARTTAARTAATTHGRRHARGCVARPGRRPVRGAGRVGGVSGVRGVRGAGRAVPLPELGGHERTPVSHTESGSLVPAPAEVVGGGGGPSPPRDPRALRGDRTGLAAWSAASVERAFVRRPRGWRPGRRRRRRRSGPSCG